jgi:hypothetical protein
MTFHSALRTSHPTLSIVVATQDSQNALEALLPRLSEVHRAYEIREIIAARHDAFPAAFQAATGDVVVTLPADGSVDPRTISAFVDLLVAGDDVASGSRFRHGGRAARRSLLGWAGTRAAHLVCNALLESRHSDLGYGFLAFWRDIVPALDLRSPSFLPVPGGAPAAAGGAGTGIDLDLAATLACRMADAKLRVCEIPVVERRIPGAAGRTALADSVRLVRIVLRERRLTARAARPVAAAEETASPQFVTAPFRLEAERNAA